jgi:hypothetical protein
MDQLYWPLTVREDLKLYRHNFITEMESVTADLRGQTWDAELLKEIDIRRIQRINPILQELREKSKFSLERAIGKKISVPASTIFAGATLNIGQYMSAGSVISLGVLGALAGGGISILEDYYGRKVELKENRLGYVIQLESNI